MKKVLTFITVGMFLVAGVTMVYAAEKAPQRVVDLANTHTKMISYFTLGSFRVFI